MPNPNISAILLAGSLYCLLIALFHQGMEWNTIPCSILIINLIGIHFIQFIICKLLLRVLAQIILELNRECFLTEIHPSHFYLEYRFASSKWTFHGFIILTIDLL